MIILKQHDNVWPKAKIMIIIPSILSVTIVCIYTAGNVWGTTIKLCLKRENLILKGLKFFSIIKFFNSREHLIDSRADQSPL